MFAPNSSRYSELSAARQIQPTKQLREFLKRAEKVGEGVIGSDLTALKHHAPRDERLQPGFETNYELVAVGDAEVYSVGALRLPLFECHARPSTGINSIINKIIERMSSDDMLESRLADQALDLGFEDDADVGFKVREVGLISRPEIAHLGEECALFVDQGAAATLFQANAELLYRSVRATGPGSEIIRHYIPPRIAVAIGRLPVQTSVEQKEVYLEWINDVLPQGGLQLQAGPVYWAGQVGSR